MNNVLMYVRVLLRKASLELRGGGAEPEQAKRAEPTWREDNGRAPLR